VLGDLPGGEAVGGGKGGAVGDEFLRHLFQVADVESVHARTAGGEESGVGGFGPGEADAAALFDDLDRGVVLGPALLVGQQGHGGAGFQRVFRSVKRGAHGGHGTVI